MQPLSSSPKAPARRRLLELHRAGAAASIALALACEAVIGIEDITDHPRPDALGAGGAQGPVGAAGTASPSADGGSSAGASPGAPDGSGGGNLAGAGGTAGTAGEPLGQAGTEGLPDAIDEPGPDTTDPGGGEPEPPPPVGIVVTGRVIDLFHRPVPGVPVSIADQTEATDADGHFSISGVEPPYDAKLMLSMTRDGRPARYGYVYEGLERPDPTLQVYSALVQRTAASFAVAINQTDFTDPERHVSVSFVSPDANFVEPSVQSDGSALAGLAWTGPSSTVGSAHAISLLRDDLDGLPILYESHGSQSLTATEGQVAVFSVDLPPSSIPESTITGAATGGGTGDRSHYVSVRFPDGTALPVIDQSTRVDDFGYLVPDLEETSLVVAAADGLTAPYAVAWQEGVAPGASDIELRIPDPVVLASPQSGAVISGATPFDWSTSNQTAQTFLFHLEFTDTYTGILVITSRSRIELPAFPDGFTVPVGTSAYWSVETHGDAANVDALAGPEGFLDPFSIGTPYPIGPVPTRASGYYTESARSSFVMGN